MNNYLKRDMKCLNDKFFFKKGKLCKKSMKCLVMNLCK